MNKTLMRLKVLIPYGIIAGIIVFFLVNIIEASLNPNWVSYPNYFNIYGEGVFELIGTLILIPFTLIYLNKKLKDDMERINTT